jgi:hypothetical protein
MISPVLYARYRASVAMDRLLKANCECRKRRDAAWARAWCRALQVAKERTGG